MKKPVYWTQEAENHLDNIYKYIAQDNAFYALRVVDNLTQRTQQLSEHPESGPIAPEYVEEKNTSAGRATISYSLL